MSDPPSPTPPTPPEPTKPTEPPAPAAAPEPLTVEKLVAPEGFTLDQDFAPKFVELAKELNLTTEGANKLVALQAELSRKGSEAATQAWEDTQKQWQEAVKSDPVIGGQNLPTVQADIANLIDTYVKQDAERAELRQAFTLTGAGNHPSVIRFLHAIAKERNEPGGVFGRPTESAQRDAASILYPNQGKA